jgi:hypothetical protein
MVRESPAELRERKDLWPHAYPRVETVSEIRYDVLDLNKQMRLIIDQLDVSVSHLYLVVFANTVLCRRLSSHKDHSRFR